MSGPTRESVMVALFDHLKTLADFKTASRRARKPESLKPGEMPALFLLEAAEVYRNASTHQPPVRRMMVQAVFYTDVGDAPNAIPATTINAILDAMDAALKPDDPMTAQFTLGRLVTSLTVDGRIVKAPGDLTGKSLAIVPLTILMP